MVRYRNPRYAPEWLERRLSPSGVSANLRPAAEVSTRASADDPPPPDEPSGEPVPEPYPLPFPLPPTQSR